MRLRLDQNRSPQLVRALADVFPGSTHARDVGLSRATDDAVWTYAARHGSVMIRRGNCSTRDIATLLRERHPDLLAFDADPAGSFLALA